MKTVNNNFLFLYLIFDLIDKICIKMSWNDKFDTRETSGSTVATRLDGQLCAEG